MLVAVSFPALALLDLPQSEVSEHNCTGRKIRAKKSDFVVCLLGSCENDPANPVWLWQESLCFDLLTLVEFPIFYAAWFQANRGGKSV